MGAVAQKKRISLFQIQHIQDVEQAGNWNRFILAEQSVSPNPFTDEISEIPQTIKVIKREFFPFQLRVGGGEVYELWCETTNSCLPELMSKIINLKLSEYIQNTINNLESAMIRPNNKKFLSDWYNQIQTLLVDLTGDSLKP